MRRIRIPNYLLVALLLFAGGAVGFLSAQLGQIAPQDRTLTITAHKYAYDPPVLRVNRGDRPHIRLVAKDVTHGFYLEGYDLDAKARPDNPTFGFARRRGAMTTKRWKKSASWPTDRASSATGARPLAATCTPLCRAS